MIHKKVAKCKLLQLYDQITKVIRDEEMYFSSFFGSSIEGSNEIVAWSRGRLMSVVSKKPILESKIEIRIQALNSIDELKNQLEVKSDAEATRIIEMLKLNEGVKT